MRPFALVASSRAFSALIACLAFVAFTSEASALPKEKAGSKRCGCTCRAENSTDVWLKAVDVEITCGFCRAKSGTSCSFVMDNVQRYGKRVSCVEIDETGNQVSERPAVLSPGTPPKKSPKAPRSERPDNNERAPG